MAPRKKAEHGPCRSATPGPTRNPMHLRGPTTPRCGRAAPGVAAHVHGVARPWPPVRGVPRTARRVLAFPPSMLTRPRSPLARGARAALLVALAMGVAPARAAELPPPVTTYPPPAGLPTLAKEDTIRLANGV